MVTAAMDTVEDTKTDQLGRKTRDIEPDKRQTYGDSGP